MYEQVRKPKENKSRAVMSSISQNKGHGVAAFQFVDNRPATIVRKQHKIVTETKHSSLEMNNSNSPIQMVRDYLTGIAPDVTKLIGEMSRLEPITQTQAIVLLKNAIALREEIESNQNIDITFPAACKPNFQSLKEAIEKLSPIAKSHGVTSELQTLSKSRLKNTASSSTEPKSKEQSYTPPVSNHELSPTANAFRESFYKKYNASHPAPLLNPDSSTLTGANYDPTTREINIGKDKTDEDFWDSALFESFNAENHGKFIAATKEKTKSTVSPTDFGQAQADIEYESMTSYIRELSVIEAKRIPLTAKAQRALDDYRIHQADYKSHFMNTPHDINAPEGHKSKLSTPVLYAYEAIESFDAKHVRSKILEFIPVIERTSDKVQLLRNKLDEMWPAVTALRPLAYDEMLNEAITTFPDLNEQYSALRLPQEARNQALVEATNLS